MQHPSLMLRQHHACKLHKSQCVRSIYEGNDTSPQALMYTVAETATERTEKACRRCKCLPFAR